MKIRSLQFGDIEQLKRINAQSSDSFPDFGSNFHNILVAVDDKGNIISAGGVELIAEGVLITDKTLPQYTRGPALVEMLSRMESTCRGLNQKFLLAFVEKDETWKRALQLYGFKGSRQQVFFKRVT